MFLLGALAHLLSCQAAAENDFGLPEVKIVVTPASDGIDLDYSIDQAVQEFPFFHSDLSIRGASWQIKESNLIISNGYVRSVDDGWFQKFHIHVKPDVEVGTNRLFGLLSIGHDGYLFSTYAVIADPRIIYSTLCVDVPQGACASENWDPEYFVIKATGPVDDITLVQRAPIYIGPQEINENWLFHSLIDPRMPTKPQQAIDSEMRRLIRFYKTSFGFELLEIPKLVVSWGGNGEGLRVASNAMVFSTIILHVQGEFKTEDYADLVADLKEHIAYRLGTFYAYGYLYTREHRFIPWFYEGLSEYLVQKSAPQSTPRSLLTKYLSYCEETLDSASSEEVDGYCGAVIHAMTDIMLINNSDGTRDWLWLLNRATKDQRHYVNMLSDEYFDALASYDMERRVEKFYKALKSGDGAARVALNDALVSFGLHEFVQETIE